MSMEKVTEAFKNLDKSLSGGITAIGNAMNNPIIQFALFALLLPVALAVRFWPITILILTILAVS